MFRSSGYVTNVGRCEEQTGESRYRNRRLRGTGPYLAHIRREDLQNQVAQAQAQLDQTMAQHTKADQDFQRAKALYSTQSLTKPDYDQSEAAFNATQAAMDNAKAALRQAELTLGDADLKAPFSGYILSRNIDVGSLVSPVTNAFTDRGYRSRKGRLWRPRLCSQSSTFRAGTDDPARKRCRSGKRACYKHLPSRRYSKPNLCR